MNCGPTWSRALLLRPPLEVDASDLANFPLEIERCRGIDLENERDVAEMREVSEGGSTLSP